MLLKNVIHVISKPCPKQIWLIEKLQGCTETKYFDTYEDFVKYAAYHNKNRKVERLDISDLRYIIQITVKYD